MRDFELFIPTDCVCANTQQENDYALKQMEKMLKADIRVSTKIRLSRKRQRAWVRSFLLHIPVLCGL